MAPQSARVGHRVRRRSGLVLFGMASLATMFPFEASSSAHSGVTMQVLLLVAALHVTTENRDAEASDPAPARCEEDSSLACTEGR